jgi:hypothetical protein
LEAAVEYLRGITVCVEYDDILALTLRRNMRHLSECLVVTSREDDRTARVVRGVKGARLFQTDAFTRDGAYFNKGLAIEETFDVLGRSGWILVWDADVLLPNVFEPGRLNRNVLYGAPRFQLPEGVMEIEGDWTRWEVLADWPGIGYFQLFHAGAEALQARPWYPTDSVHAGMSDWYFTTKFALKEWLPYYVLHIGRREENWFGRATPRLDGVPVPEADRRRLQIGEMFLDLGWTSVRPDLQALALAARANWKGATASPKRRSAAKASGNGRPKTGKRPR